MKEFYKFMSENPILAFFLALILAAILEGLFLRLPNIIMRHWNIHKHGYPPAHCDADGDFKEEEE